MILHQLIDRLDFFQRSLHINPVRLNHLIRAEIRQLLDKRQHPRPQSPNSRLPFFNTRMAGPISPDPRFHMVDPRLFKELFDVLKSKEMAEQKLVS